jgi:hypothetical protein
MNANNNTTLKGSMNILVNGKGAGRPKDVKFADLSGREQRAIVKLLQSNVKPLTAGSTIPKVIKTRKYSKRVTKNAGTSATV